jgi:hypothetical protein
MTALLTAQPTLAAALAAATTLLAIAFALCIFERWVERRRAHHAAWTAALALFAVASAAQWTGAAVGWAGWSFRAFYLLGPILSVPYLALGTVLLLSPRATGRSGVAIGVHVYAGFASGVLVVAPLTSPISGTELPQGADVFGVLPRVLAAAGSGLPSLVIVGGAVLSAVRFARRDGPGRLVVGNVLIAVGTLVLGVAGLFNSVLDEMSAFALGHAIGLSLVFAGFLVTGRPRGPARALRVVGSAQRATQELPAEAVR